MQQLKDTEWGIIVLMLHLITKLPLEAAVKMWQLYHLHGAQTHRNPKSVQLSSWHNTSCYCKACVMFSVSQDLQQKQSHTTRKKCTYRVIGTSKWQCKWCSFLYYTQHLLQGLSRSSQHFSPALSEGLGDGAARGTPWPSCCLRLPEPRCSSSSQELGQHTPHF